MATKKIARNDTLQGSDHFLEWCDKLEDTLHSEASHAGLLEQGSLVGSAREFFVSRVLKSILPSSVHIGSGRIIGAGGGQSRQIDIIVYDPRCPFLEIRPGIGLYFVEGVIASIEVKSTITKKNLIEALDNCRSVNSISAQCQSTAPLNVMSERLLETGLSGDCVADAVVWATTPRTYIFAFRSALSTDTLAHAVDEWYSSQMANRTAHYPGLPFAVVTKGSIGLLDDSPRFTIFSTQEDLAGIRDKFGQFAKVVMGFWKTDRHFGWLAVRLILDVQRRLWPTFHLLSDVAIENRISHISLTIDGYLPIRQYAERHMKGKGVGYVVWEPNVGHSSQQQTRQKRRSKKK